MDGFLSDILMFPTVVYTLLLGFAVVYWTLVVVGGADIDAIDVGGGLDGAVDGAIEGAIEGAVEGAAEAAADGALDGAEGGLAGVLSALRLRKIPVTISLTALSSWGFVLSYVGMATLSPLIGTGWLPSLAVGAGSLVGGVAMTSLTLRPFGRFFETHAARSKHHLIGHVCTISTGKVDARFGQASCEDGGAGLILSVRYEGEGPLTRGQQALIVDYDPARDVFQVEPMDPLLEDRRVG